MRAGLAPPPLAKQPQKSPIFGVLWGAMFGTGTGGALHSLRKKIFFGIFFGGLLRKEGRFLAIVAFVP